MPPKAKLPPAAQLPTSTFVVDNGAYTMKAGFAPSSAGYTNDLTRCTSVPNAIVRTRDRHTYVGPQLQGLTDWNDVIFRRPVERGQLVNWEAEKEIWEYTFFDETTAKKDLLVKSPKDTTLVLTEAPNGLAELRRNADEIVMEEWGFGGYLRCIGPSLNAWNDLHTLFENPAPASANTPRECLLVVDSGYSHTTVTPLYNGQPLQRAVRRLEVGGKHLTNLLTEIVSVRHYDLHTDVQLVSDMKEAACYVSLDFAGDMEKTWRGNRKDRDLVADGIVKDYVLPDNNTVKKGFMRDYDPLAAAKKRKRGLEAPSAEAQESVMTLGNERFMVPEVLFNPQDISLKQAGLPDLIMQSLSVLPPAVQAAMLCNILVVGGNVMIPNFLKRLEMELRQIAPAECEVKIRQPEDPIKSTWLGGANMAGNRDHMKTVAITKKQYEEHGSAWGGRKFAGGATK